MSKAMHDTDLIARVKNAVSLQGESSSDYDLNPGLKLADDRNLTPAAVLIAIEPRADQTRLYLTKRASSLKHHPGQIALPGGKVDAADKGSVVAAALREAEEEIGLPTAHVDTVGSLPNHETVTSFVVTPVVGLVTTSFEPRAEEGEVEEVFSVPLAHVLNPENYVVQSRIWRGVARYYNTVAYGPYYIWGATARILRVLADKAAL